MDNNKITYTAVSNWDVTGRWGPASGLPRNKSTFDTMEQAKRFLGEGGGSISFYDPERRDFRCIEVPGSYS